MLTSQFSAKFKPVIKQVLSCHNYFERLESDILISLCLVVAVDLLQAGVEHLCKLAQVFWRLGKLYEPLMATLCILIHKHWCCCILRHLCPCLFTGKGQALLCIVHYQLLAEGVYEMLRTSGDNKLIRISGCKLNGIAYLIAPQSAAGRYHHSIVLACFHSPKGDGFSRIHRYELIEHIVVEHQKHRLV